jgi:hypothetical protein
MKSSVVSVTQGIDTSICPVKCVAITFTRGDAPEMDTAIMKKIRVHIGFITFLLSWATSMLVRVACFHQRTIDGCRSIAAPSTRLTDKVVRRW